MGENGKKGLKGFDAWNGERIFQQRKGFFDASNLWFRGPLSRRLTSSNLLAPSIPVGIAGNQASATSHSARLLGCSADRPEPPPYLPKYLGSYMCTHKRLV